MHAFALASIAVLSPFSLPLAAAGAAVVLAHAWLARPHAAPGAIHRLSTGRWSVPARGLVGARLGARTRYTDHWVRLELVEPGRSPTAMLLLRDQLDPESWRVLQGALRRARARPSAEASSEFG